VKLNLVIAESALELVPDEIRRSPAVVNDAKRRERDPSKILLDRSIHHAAMVRLKEDYKRGRPDIVYVTLLSVTGTPLYEEGSVKVYVHTRGDAVLEIAEGTRLPKSYFRFRNLVEKHLSERSDSELIRTHEMPIRELLRKVVKPDLVIGLSTQGETRALEELAGELVGKKYPCVVIGGFPHGHFSERTLGELDGLVRIHRGALDAHVVASRLVYEVEKATRGKNQ
jgi:rRNA small subunit pseudouridine methyltransferase Nep1